MLVYTYDTRLVIASVAISMMAAFTGLSLTRGLSGQPETPRLVRIVMAAIALGVGIWSMHFVAMLAMRFDVVVYYEALHTVASVLIAILLAGIALLLMHFGRRTPARATLAGAVLGAGIVAMHYVGLSGIKGCTLDYRPAGFVATGALAVGMGIAAIRVAYSRRTERQILLGTLIFGSSVVIAHFGAMHWTGFRAVGTIVLDDPAIGQGQLALIVLIASFLISGAFLLSGASFLSRPATAPAVPLAAIPPASLPADPDTRPAPLVRLPYEKDGKTFLIAAAEVAALRAEGHYTIVYLRSAKVFCPWSISEAERRLSLPPFFRAHRSYLINTDRVTAFERNKDNGYCLFDGFAPLGKVPVARARVNALRDRLGF